MLMDSAELRAVLPQVSPLIALTCQTIADGRINYNGAELRPRGPAVLTARNYPDTGRADL